MLFQISFRNYVILYRPYRIFKLVFRWQDMFSFFIKRRITSLHDVCSNLLNWRSRASKRQWACDKKKPNYAHSQYLTVNNYCNITEIWILFVNILVLKRSITKETEFRLDPTCSTERESYIAWTFLHCTWKALPAYAHATGDRKWGVWWRCYPVQIDNSTQRDHGMVISVCRLQGLNT